MWNKQEIPPLLLHSLGQARLKHIPGGQIILYEGDLPTEVYILKTGVVRIYDIDEQGNEKVLHIVKPPSVMPFAFFSGLKSPLKWFYAALTDCDMYVVSQAKFAAEIRANGELGQLVTTNFSEDVHELLVHLSSLGKTKSRDKIVAVLKFLQVCHATERRSGWWRVNFAASHQLLADMAGITRESASVVLKHLQRENIIRNPRLTILEINREKLIQC